MAKRRANGEGNLRKQKDGRWEGRYTAGRDPETGRVIYKNVLGKTQAEAKAKLKQAIEESERTGHGQRLAGTRWGSGWRCGLSTTPKIKSTAILPPDLPGLHRQPHQAQTLARSPWKKLTSLELQKICKKLLNSGRIDRVESKRQPRGLSPKTVRNICQIIASAMKPAKE